MPTDDIEASDGSLVDALSVMAEWQDSSRVVEENGTLFVEGKSRFPMPYSNAVFPTVPEPDAERVLAAASGFFPDRRYVLWTRGGTDELGKVAVARGFVAIGETPAMVIDEPIPESSSNIDVTRVTLARELEEFVLVSQLAYAEAGLPAAITSSYFARADRVIASAVLAVAHLGGAPAAAALAITNGVTGVGGVYWVGTVPAARRRGAATAVTRYVTNAAFEQGATVVTLQATQAGEPVYRRLGYRVVGRYAHLVSPKT